MKTLNKPTLIFLFVVSTIFFTIFQILQSPKVAELISIRLTKVLRKEGFQIKFDKVDLQIFPPTTYFNNIEVHRVEKKGLKLFLKAKRVGFHFGVLDFFSSKFIVSKLSIWDAVIKVDVKTKTGGVSKFKIKSLKKLKIKQIQEFYVDEIIRNIPFTLRSLELDEINLFYNDHNLMLDALKVGLSQRTFSIEGRVEQIKYFKSPNFKVNEQEFVFDINVNQNKVEIHKLDIINREDRIGFKGELTNGNDSISVNGVISFLGRIENLAESFGPLSDDEIVEGLVEAEIILTKDIFNPDAKIKAEFFDLISKYEQVESVSFLADKIGDRLTILKLNIKDEFASIELKEKIIIPNLKKIDNEKIKPIFKVKNFPTKVALYYVDSLSPIKGLLNGELEVSVKGRDIHFKLLEGFAIKDFKLWFPDTKTPLLANQKITTKRGEVVIKNNGNVSVDLDFIFPNSRIIVAGEVFGDEDSLFFETKEGTRIDFKELGPIAGINIEGSGPVKIEVSGDSDKVTIGLIPSLDNFSILDFKFGKAEGEIDYIINENKLVVKKLESIFGKTTINAKGHLIFGDNQSIDISIENSKATYQDSLEMYHTIIKGIKLVPRNLTFDYTSKFKIKGPLNLEQLAIEGQVKMEASTLLFEEINSSQFNFKFQHNKINIFDLKIVEGKGSITGEFEYDLKDSDLNYKVNISGVRTTDIEILNAANLGFEGVFDGEWVGSRKNDFFTSICELNIINSTIGDMKVPDSRITFSTEGKMVFVKGALLSDRITFNSYLNFNKKEISDLSYLNLNINSNKIKELLGVLATHNMMDEELEGEIKLDFKSKFNLFDMRGFNAEFNFEKFTLSKGNINLALDKDANKIIVKNGEIKIWDLVLRDDKNILSFKGEGQIYDKFKITAGHKIDAEIYKFLTPRIKVAKGYSEGKLLFVGNKGRILTNILLAGNLEKLSIHGIPNYFEDLQFNLSLENKDLLIQKFNGRYGRGLVDISGGVMLDYPHTGVDIEYQFSNIKLPIMKLKKSFVLVSGKGSIKGNEAPYDLGGKYSIVYGDLRNEIYEFLPSVQVSTFYEKYLPKELVERDLPAFNLDLDVNITAPIELKNSLMEILFDGNITVTGTSEEPIFNGDLSVVPDKSKVVFKSNEFNLQVGEIKLVNAPNENPEIKFSGTAKVKEYEVKFELGGSSDNISMDFSSDPFLSKEDILSLLTLGITSEDAQGLSESEREAITSIGLGSLLADQLKINQGLSSGLGLKLSVIPEIEENTNYSGSEQREGVISPYATRYKSATSVQVKKQITKKLNLSISSRVGGSIDQKQRMSADYYINKGISLEGVYELKTTQDANISNVTNAFGADLIFRWSFK